MYSFRNGIKQVHLFLFIFFLCELAYGGIQYNPVMPVVRKMVLAIGLVYSIIFITKIPVYMRIVLAGMSLLLLHLIGESVNRYGTLFESINYTSQILYPVIAVGGFVACLWIKQVKIAHVVVVILVLCFINQIVLGRVTQHHFNSDERSVTAAEAYYLLIPLIYFLDIFLIKNQVRYFYYFVIVFALIIVCFHRTVWVTASVAIVVNWVLIRQYTRVNSYNFVVRLAPVFAVLLLIIGPILYVKPELLDNISSSISDIQNANNQGTGGWRSEQRDVYMNLFPEHPFLGWTYEGYDRGEVMASDATEDWVTAKGTFIHSAYVYTLYNFGMIGLLIQFGLILFTMINLYKVFNREEPGEWALFIFISSGWIYAWSYQLPDFYWGFIGIGIYFIYRAKKAAQWFRKAKNIDYSISAAELV